jgi:hypothetical protein
MADFSLLQTPNFAGAVLGGYQAGQQMGRQKQLDSAMANIDLERPETLLPLLRADPSTGAALIGASVKLSAEKRMMDQMAAKSNLLVAESGGDSASPAPAPAAPAAADATGASVATGMNNAATANGADTNALDQGEVTVTAHRNAPDPLHAARVAYMRADPDGYVELETKLAGMSKAQRDNVVANNDFFDNVLQGVKTIPPTDIAGRQAFIQKHRDQLLQAGIPPQQIDSFVPTDANITAMDNQVLTVKGVNDKIDKDRDFALKQSSQAETARHDRVDESQGAARVGIEGGNLHVSQQRLSDEEKGIIGKGGQGGPAPIPTRIIGGKTYYNVGGKWFDNPEGR